MPNSKQSRIKLPKVAEFVQPAWQEVVARHRKRTSGAILRMSALPPKVLWGEGGAFCAGWDLKYASSLKGDKPLASLDFPAGGGKPPRGPLGPTRLQPSKPVIAAMEGPAVAGGMELALWCDLRVMAESAYIGVYCRRWGIPLLDGGTVRLPRLVGQARARNHSHGSQGHCRRMLSHRCLRATCPPR